MARRLSFTRLSALEKENALARLELERLNAEREGMRDLHRATLNLLEDVDEERSKYYNAQRALLNLLEDADEERSRVEHTKARLELVNNELETFSSSVSHDLQAPLQAIKGLSQAVLEDQQDRLDEVGRRYLVPMRDSAIKMEILIEDVLEFSRLNRQSMMRSHIDLSSIARSTFAELYALEQGRNIALVTNGTPLVTGTRPCPTRHVQPPFQLHQVHQGQGGCAYRVRLRAGERLLLCPR